MYTDSSIAYDKKDRDIWVHHEYPNASLNSNWTCRCDGNRYTDTFCKESRVDMWYTDDLYIEDNFKWKKKGKDMV